MADQRHGSDCIRGCALRLLRVQGSFRPSDNEQTDPREFRKWNPDCAYARRRLSFGRSVDRRFNERGRLPLLLASNSRTRGKTVNEREREGEGVGEGEGESASSVDSKDDG